MTVSFNLLVLYAQDLLATKAFYESLGLTFIQEQHGKGPLHYAAELNPQIFEIYPAQKDQPPATAKAAGTTMLGFQVDNLEGVLTQLATLGIQPQKPPVKTEWGLRCVVNDPDGRLVDLTQP